MINILNTRLFYNKFFFISMFLSIIILINVFYFYELFTSNEFSFYFIDKIHTFPSNITNILKLLYIVSLGITWCFILNILYNNVIQKVLKKINSNQEIDNNLNKLIIGKNTLDNSIVSIPEKGLYQNILITRNYWNWQNIFRHVSIYKTNNGNGVWDVNP